MFVADGWIWLWGISAAAAAAATAAAAAGGGGEMEWLVLYNTDYEEQYLRWL